MSDEPEEIRNFMLGAISLDVFGAQFGSGPLMRDYINGLKLEITRLEQELAKSQKMYRDFDEAVLVMTHELDDHPDGYDWSCDCAECRSCQEN